MAVLTNVIRADDTEAVEGSETRPVIEPRNSWADADAESNATRIASRLRWHAHLARALTGGTPVPLFDRRTEITSLIRKQDLRVAAIAEIAALNEWDQAADLL